MSWTAPVTWVDGSVLTAAQLNTFIRDNLLETSPAKAATDGGYFVTDSVNRIGERNVAQDILTLNETTQSSEYVDLTTRGPGVTVISGSSALVLFGGKIAHSAEGGRAAISFKVEGASDIPASDDWAMFYERNYANDFTEFLRSYYIQTLTPGLNTFALQYKTYNTGTANFSNRKLIVIPL